MVSTVGTASIDHPSSPMGSAPARECLSGPYLLITNIGAVSEGSRIWIQELWHKDLKLHLGYIKSLVLACPVRSRAPKSDETPLDVVSSGAAVSVCGLPDPRSTLIALFTLPVTAWSLWNAVGKANLVHCGVAGWPLPLGWVAAPMAKLRSRPLIVVVESAPWRNAPGVPRSIRGSVRGAIYERVARAILRLADVAFYTQAEYQRSLPVGRGGRGFVLPASWLDEEFVLSLNESEELWRERIRSAGERLRIAFVGRLTAAKGIVVLLDAMERVRATGCHVRLDIFGDGDLRVECERRAANVSGVEVVCCGTLPYGREFYQALRPFHAIVVPSLSDEQPRVVYDAFSQALPVIASDTPGLQGCVGADRGTFVAPGDPERLAAAIVDAAGDVARLRMMGLAARESAASYTHSQMHEERRRVLVRELASRGGSESA